MTQVVRRGGYLVVQGWRREGTAEGWNGLHQHDLYLESTRLMCQSRGRAAHAIDEGLPLAVVEIAEENVARPWIRIIYKKNFAAARPALRS